VGKWSTRSAAAAARRVVHLSTARSGSRLILFEALAEAEGLANEFEDVGVMGQTIQQGGGQPFIAEDLRPVREFQVAGDDQRHAFV